MFKWIFCKVHHEDFPFVLSQVVITWKITYVNHAGGELTDSSFCPAAISFFALLVLSITNLHIFHFANYRFPFRKFKTLSSFNKLQVYIYFRFVFQTTVSPRYDSAGSKLRLNSDIRTSEATLHTDVQRELWNVRKVVRPSIKNLGIGNLPSLVCNFSLKSFCGLWMKRQFWPASLLQLSCINQTVMDYFFRHHFTFEPLSRIIFSLSFNEIREIFTRFLYHDTSLYRWERLRN